MHKVSILITCSNHGNYIKQTIGSALSQNYNDLEIVVVDDSDSKYSKCWKYLKKFSNKHENIKIHRNHKKLYCGSSYNKALSLSTGDICFILDGDDMLMENVVSDVVNVYKAHPEVAYVYTQHEKCKENMNRYKLGSSRIPYEGSNLLIMNYKYRIKCFSHLRTFKPKYVKNIDLFGNKLKYAIDQHMGFQLEQIGPGIFYRKTCYRYRTYKKNMTHVNSNLQRISNVVLTKRFKQYRKVNKINAYPIGIV